MQKLFYYALSGLLLTACSGKAIESTKVSYPVESVLANQYSTASSFNLHANVDGIGKLLVSNKTTISPDTEFNGIKVKSSQTRTIMKKGDQVISDTTGTEYFKTKPFENVGYRAERQYDVVVRHTTLPARAIIGDGGEINRTVSYLSESMEVKDSSNIYTWSLKEASKNTAWLCQEFYITYVSRNNVDVEGSTCTEIDAKGTVLREQMSIGIPTRNGFKNLVFTSK